MGVFVSRYSRQGDLIRGSAVFASPSLVMSVPILRVWGVCWFVKSGYRLMREREGRMAWGD